MFQSLLGRLKTNRPPSAGIGRCWVSIPLREAKNRIDPKRKVQGHEFQSLLGRLKTVAWGCRCHVLPVFQSLLGRLKTTRLLTRPALLRQVSIPLREAKNNQAAYCGDAASPVSIPLREAKNGENVHEGLRDLLEFQSLLGRLKTCKSSNHPASAYPCFNPS
ncbi:MAG: hypothetical protein PWQ97_259 [Tepidanaerobacteraceae bacterium]|nr:hypothetical protein [Tepidanaerobacteraceae bacterium]